MGLGTVVEVEVVDVDVHVDVVDVDVDEGGITTTVDIVATEVEGSTVGAGVALCAAHPMTDAHSAISDDRAAIRRRITRDLPLRP
jgi:hypothetical protein